MYGRNRLGDLPQPEGRAITYSDVQSALVEAYGTHHPDGSVTGVPPVTPIALDQAYTTWLQERAAELHNQGLHQQANELAFSLEANAAYAELGRQYGTLAPIAELLERYPLIVPWLERRAAVGDAYEAQKWEVYRGERTNIDPGALDAAAGPVVMASEQQKDQARRSSELPVSSPATTTPAPRPGEVPVAYATAPIGRPDLAPIEPESSAAMTSGIPTWVWFAALGAAVLLGKSKRSG